MTVLLLSWSISSFATDGSVDYAREIRPILSNHCFQCHGADAESREADLRLDVRESAIESGAVIPGRPNESELVARITSNDELLRMPPDDANKPLTPEQIDKLVRWVKQGAEVSDHWAFERVRRPVVPAVQKPRWAENPIDHFILKRLEQSSLAPSSEADRYTLIRRLYQDLLGLLPTPEEAEGFANDASPDAYTRLVERLLASPHYGERWGRHWLDQARYADSHGYTIDGPRIMWPYRDWVIQAINSDLPFDEFTIEQLAGDLLPEAEKNQLIATAFHRNTMINQEGGVKPDQFRHEATIDRVNTTGAVWLGLTIGCAQCHSHKYDPITQEEYYRLYAFFNGAVDQNNVGPTVSVRQQEVFGWTETQRQLLDEFTKLQAREKALEKKVKEGASLGDVDWTWTTASVNSAVADNGVSLKKLEDQSLLADASVSDNAEYTVELAIPDSLTDQGLTAVRLRVLTDDSLPQQGPGLAGNGNFVLTGFELASGGNRIPLSQAWADHSQPNYDVAGAIDGDAKTGWAINVDGAQSKAGKKMNAPHEAIFVLAKPLSNGILTISMKHEANQNYQVGRFAVDLTTTRLPAQEETTKAQAELATAKTRIQQIQSLLPGKAEPVSLMVMKEMDKKPETYLLERGDFLVPDKDHGPLENGVPESLVTVNEIGPMPSRLDLAMWLVSRENPLTARVTVNRIWSRFFGRGLVETENDFGFQGTLPTHPGLLDWLSADFMENGWSLKHLHRRIVLSATYRQSSVMTPDHLKHDPSNYLLARQSRFRVEAEIVRDQVLSASGLLTPKLGGPSVHPPQPDGVYNFTQNKKNWPTETGPDRYRRTMYTMFYRSAPYPLLQTFDAPDFSTVCTRRVRSNTPLQSLTVANDDVFRELAVGLAQRVLNDLPNGEFAERIRLLHQLMFARPPETSEQQVLQDFSVREWKRFSDHPQEAREFLQSTKVDDRNLAETAVWSSIARVLMNTDEFLTRN
ncbi:MAG: PSD1 domain-containing protein [Planctomycetaceae bacterium]|nr:PSD1 domain-containing protein [Planctomycetaceae bacterium]